MRHGQQQVLIECVSLEEVPTNPPKVVANVKCLTQPEGEEVTAKIWITEKAAGMARRAFKQCGFDLATRSLQELVDDPGLLKGNSVLCDIFDDGVYGLKCEIVLSMPPAKETLAGLDAMLKAAKKTKAADVGPVYDPDRPDSIPF
mgnify:CR=1 FL=1